MLSFPVMVLRLFNRMPCGTASQDMIAVSSHLSLRLCYQYT